MKISEKLQTAINSQIVNELWSVNLYLSMSLCCTKDGFSGFAHWLDKQSIEEKQHATMLADYLIKRGGTAKVGAIKEVPFSWETPLELFKAAYAHECKVSQQINDVLDIAIADKDKASEEFLWTFVREQVEEEATTEDIVNKIKKLGDAALYYMDENLGQRK